MKKIKLVELLIGLTLLVGCSATEMKVAESAPPTGKETTSISISIPSQADTEAAFVGCWHAVPGIPADYADRFIFFINHRFVFVKNKFSTEERELSYAGTWELTDGNLVLTVLRRDNLVGGQEIPRTDFDIQVGEFEIIGGKIERTILDEPEVFSFPFAGVEYDKENAYNEIPCPFTVQIGETQFWKFDYFDDIKDLYYEFGMNWSFK